VVRSGIAVAFGLVLLGATAAHAQPAAFTGLLSGQLGIAASGDVRDWSVAPGASMAVVDRHLMGLEIDASHVGDFDTARFADSSITTVMLNFIAHYPHEQLRPYAVAGAGVVRMRAEFGGPQSAVAITDTAWTAGGGVLYMLSDALGFRADVRYIRQFGRQDRLPLGGNGTLDFVRSSFGVTYSWPVQ
jgi:opacity protein-like surface antigen